MTDPLSMIAPLNKFLDRYEPDLMNLPPCFSIRAMARSQFTAGRWPGLNGLPENTEYLMMGDKQRVIDETKRIIVILAPGGGFIMSNSPALDQVKTENLEAWKDTVFEYGKYR